MTTNDPLIYQVTEYAPPGEMMTTQWGNIPYSQYLEAEMRRWKEKNYRDAWVKENSEGMIAMFGWADDMLATGEE